MSIPTPHNSAKKGDIAKKVLMRTLLAAQSSTAKLSRLITKRIRAAQSSTGRLARSISKKVQDKVKTTVENMTGMEVANVNVNIASVATN